MVAENELTFFTFENGRKVLIKHVSPFTLNDARKTIPVPKPPIQDVDYGDGKIRQEVNKAHPDYLEAVRTYNERAQDVARGLVIKRGCFVELNEEERAKVAELRAYWLEELGQELKGSDEYLFISHLCIGSPEELERLLSQVLGMGQPTAEVIAAAKESFPGVIPE